MNAEITQTTVQRINALHGEICQYVKWTLSKAIQIGELLSEEREKHAKTKGSTWRKWVADNLTFSDSAATKYIRLYRARDKFPSLEMGIKTAEYLVAKPSRGSRGPYSSKVQLPKRWEEIEPEEDARPLEDYLASESVKVVQQSLQAETELQQETDVGISYHAAKKKVIACWKMMSDGESRRAARHLAKVMVDFLFKIYPDLQDEPLG